MSVKTDMSLQTEENSETIVQANYKRRTDLESTYAYMGV